MKFKPVELFLALGLATTVAACGGSEPAEVEVPVEEAPVEVEEAPVEEAPMEEEGGEGGEEGGEGGEGGEG